MTVSGLHFQGTKKNVAHLVLCHIKDWVGDILTTVYMV